MAKLKISSTPASMKLELFTKGLVSTGFLGSYKSVFKGRGLEFESYRTHTHTDDASNIDWKASLRANKTLVKEFVEERESHTFLLIDVSSTMFFGSIPKLKNEYAAELASSLCYAILKSSDSVGFALFSNKIVQKSFPIHDNKQFYLLMKSLTDQKNYGGACNFKEAIRFAMHYLRPLSILIIISDFIGLGENWELSLKFAAKRLDVMGIMVRDPRDKTLPPMKRMVLVEDTISGKQLLIQPESIMGKYSKYVSANESKIKDIFKKSGAHFISLSTDKEFSKPMREYFKKRLKQFT